MEYGVHGNLIVIYPKPYSIYLRGTIRVLTVKGMKHGISTVEALGDRLMGYGI